jgi:DNA (cytosine-5)-methyltransferase 1
LENVKQLATHNKGATLRVILKTLNELGYKTYWEILNALDFGLPQKRERAIIVGFLNHKTSFSFPKASARGNLADILEPDENVPQKYFASERIKQKRIESHKSEFYPSVWHENKSGNISSYPYSCALRAGASHNYLLVNGVRRLTPREMLRLQGFPDSFQIVCNDYQTRKQAGNAVPVNVIKAALEKALEADTMAQ